MTRAGITNTFRRWFPHQSSIVRRAEAKRAQEARAKADSRERKAALAKFGKLA